MEASAELLKKLNGENLAEEIEKATRIPQKQAKEEIEKFIVPRLDFMWGKRRTLYFLFEEGYVETEWKDMISIHYINTSYAVKNTVMRVHLFVKKEISQDKYAGCFTLRTIDDIRFMLSYIYPNWEKISFENVTKSYVMCYRKKIHILGTEIEFPTYPLFVQDNAVVKCAEASMVSMTNYLHAKYDYNRVRILNIAEAYISGKTKTFPSKGLTPVQMLEVFNYYNIPTECQICYDGADELKEYVDFCLESAMPVLLSIGIKNKETGGIDKHIIQIIGHTLVGTENVRAYIVYDDSGCFIRSFKGMDGFVKAIFWEGIEKSITPQKSFVIYPMHEKVYISYHDIKDVFDDLQKRVKIEDILKKAGEEISGKRILLVDNAILKNFLRHEIELDDTMGNKVEMEREIEKISARSFPHYLWYCEFQTKNSNLIYFADPTYNNKTSKDIIINQMPIISKNVLGLLGR